MYAGVLYTVCFNPFCFNKSFEQIYKVTQCDKKKYKRKTFVGTNYENLLLKQFERFKLNEKKLYVD